MKYLSEYRDARIAKSLARRIRAAASRRWVLMEVCGGQTHTIVRQGIDELVDGAVEMIHGPGCPVCVTPLEQIDRAVALASNRDVIFTSFGDMLRVPGSECDLQQVCAHPLAGGAHVVDYADLHYYPQGQNVALSDDDSPATAARRLRSLKELYDPNWISESWISDLGDSDANHYDKPNLIPRVRAWIESLPPVQSED